MSEICGKVVEEPFTTAGLADAIRQPRWLAQKMTYCPRSAGAISKAGKRGRATQYVHA